MRNQRTVLAVLALLFVACSSSDKEVKSSNDAAAQKSPKLAPRSPRIEVSGSRLLGEAEQSRFDSAQFYEKVASLLERKRKASARRLVERFPELATQVLRNSFDQKAADKVILWMALFHDEHSAASKQNNNWYRTLTKRSSQAQALRDYQRIRATTKQALARGEPKLLPDLGGDLTRFGSHEAIEGYELRGLTYLLGEEFAKAIPDFEKVLELGRAHDPLRAAHGALWLSDASRRNGDKEAAQKAWTQAVELGSESLLQKRPLCSPRFWEQAAYMKPSGMAYPKLSNERLAAFLGLKAEGLKGELLVWTLLTHVRGVRKEHKAALLASKKAQAICDKDELRRRLQMHEAKALLGLERPGAAQSVLTPLVKEKSPEASALLGSLAVQRGQLREGFLLLSGALKQNQEDWSGRAKAEGDLGLAYLLMGNEEKGRGWLHKAQESFERTRNNEALAQSLRNEARYLKFKEREDEALILMKRVAELEN